jgi:hypothetical protein
MNKSRKKISHEVLEGLLHEIDSVCLVSFFIRMLLFIMGDYDKSGNFDRFTNNCS